MSDAYGLQVGQIFPGLRDDPLPGSFTLNQSTDKVETIFQAQEDATITRLGVRISTITNSVTWKIGLQGVGTTGNSDGSYLLNSGSPASATFNPTSLSWSSGDFRWVTLDNSIAVTRGQMLAYVIEYVSGTLGSQVITNNGFYTNSGGFPYTIGNDNGSRSRSSNMPIFGYGSSTKAYGNPIKNAATYSYNSSSSPDEYAIAFTLPTQFCSSYKVRGVDFGAFRPNTASQTWTMTLYSGTTALQQIQFDSDVWSANVANYAGKFFFDESSLSSLTAGSTYRIGFAPDNSSITLSPYYFEVASAADWDAFPMGQNFWISSRTDAGAWTDVTTRRFNANILLDDITAPSGGGLIIGNTRASSLSRR